MSGTAAFTGGFSDMGPGIFLIAIMGCGDGDGQCRTVRTLDTPYQTRAECVAATEAAAGNAGDVDYPLVVAQCVAGRSKASVTPAELKLPAGGRVDVRSSPLRG